MHLTFILVKITLLNARVTSVRAVCCVAKFFSISHKSGSQAEVRGEFIYPALKLYFLPFFWAPFSSKTKDARARKISAVDPVVSQLVSLSMFLESGY